MSELKAYTAPNMEGRGLTDYYLKSEADKVIAELEADRLTLRQRVNVLEGRLYGLSQSHNIKTYDCGCLEREISELKDKLRHYPMMVALLETDKKELRQQKYKRCLAMAQVLEHVCPMTNRKAKWRDKWHKRWLEIAEQFKPNNSTAQ